MNIRDQMLELGKRAKLAAAQMALIGAADKAHGLASAAAAIRAHKADILAANAADMAAASHLDAPMRDRLLLTDARVEAIAIGLEKIAALPDPVGRVLAAWDVVENGLHIEKVGVPLGVIGIIYESRPNVTAEASAIALKAGNAVILRGGSESFHSSRALLNAMRAGLKVSSIPPDAAQLVPTIDREAVSIMLAMNEHIDVIIPRGGKSLTERVKNEARVPTLLHLDGNCHLYIDSDADATTAQRVVINAKMRRTGICGALETLLIHRDCLTAIAPAIISELLEKGCELRGDPDMCRLDPHIKLADGKDWVTEYLAPILAIKVVDSVEEAVAHINRYGSHHTDGIITQNEKTSAYFTNAVDSAIVTVNASTQFADGGEFGFGAEIGIATGKLHARGPVAAAELTTYKYRVTTTQAGGAVRAG